MSFRSRSFNTTAEGHAFPIAVINQVWIKGRVIPNYSPNEWRYDTYGTPMKYGDYGKIDSKYGWEVDHIYPSSKGGSDALNNLQPLQWENNRKKGDTIY